MSRRSAAGRATAGGACPHRVLGHADGWAVLCQERGGTALRAVQVGRSNRLETEVQGRLAEGDPVILHPSGQVKDRAPITARLRR
jgi:hypothetical protein